MDQHTKSVEGAISYETRGDGSHGMSAYHITAQIQKGEGCIDGQGNRESKHGGVDCPKRIAFYAQTIRKTEGRLSSAVRMRLYIWGCIHKRSKGNE